MKADQGSSVAKVCGLQLNEHLENVTHLRSCEVGAAGFQFGQSMMEGFRGYWHFFTERTLAAAWKSGESDSGITEDTKRAGRRPML